MKRARNASVGFRDGFRPADGLRRRAEEAGVEERQQGALRAAHLASRFVRRLEVIQGREPKAERRCIERRQNNSSTGNFFEVGADAVG